MHLLLDLNELNQMTQLTTARFPYHKHKVFADVPGVSVGMLKYGVHSACEVFAYLAAEVIGLRVPKMQGCWGSRTFSDHGPYTSGRIGIFVEHFDDWQELPESKAIKLDLEFAIRAMAFQALARHEPGMFGSARGQVFYVDLDGFLLHLRPEVLLSSTESERNNELACAAAMYIQSSRDTLADILKASDRLGIRNEVLRELDKICNLPKDQFIETLKIDGHPLSDVISGYASSSLVGRLEMISEEVS